MRGDKQGKRGFKKRYIFMMLLFMVLAAFGIFRRHTHNLLKQRIKALQHQGYPMNPAELDVWYKESFPDDVDNGWHLYDDAFEEFFGWSDQYSNNLPVYGRNINYGRGEAWKPIRLLEAQALLADNKACLDLLYEAAETGSAQAPYDFSQGRALKFPELGEAWECSRLLRLAGHTAVTLDDVETSVMAIRAMFSLADSIGAPSFFCNARSILMRGGALQVMEDLLNVHALSETQLQTLQTMVDRAAIVRLYEQALIGQRVMSLEIFQASPREPEMVKWMIENDRIPEFWSVFIILRQLLGLHDLDTLSYINTMQASLEAVALPTHEALPRLSVIGKAHHEKLGMVGRSLERGASNLYVSFARTMAELRSAGAALAIERFRLANGRLPDGLQELVPDILQNAPLDPFDGQQLRYRQLDPGYVVYSIGQDLTDNQGEERKSHRERRGQKEWDETFIVER